MSGLLERTEKFPKAVRFTFTNRIDGLALDILSYIIEARYLDRSRKGVVLSRIDIELTKLRVLLRLCHQRRYLSHQAYENLQSELDTAGRMVGGWQKSL